MGNKICNNDSRPGISALQNAQASPSSKAKMEAYQSNKQEGLKAELGQRVRQTIENQKFSYIKIEQQKNPKPVIYGGDFYLGDLEGNRPNGFGRMYKENGCVYIGHFKEGKAHGKGAFVFTDGSFYQGQFRNNNAETANGYYHSEQSTYEGGFKDNKFTGKGIDKGKNFRYQGFFQNGVRKQGVLEWQDQSGKYRYQGEFNQNNQFHGKGLLEEPRGKFDGTFENGQKHGEKCIYYSENGSRYQGPYVNGYREGYGVIYKDDEILYKGQMRQGKPSQSVDSS